MAIMFINLLTIILAIVVPSLGWGLEELQAPQSRESFCEQSTEPDFARRILSNRYNQISFNNQGGIADKGVCWWHSIFTRNSAYLVYFSPELPKPSRQEAEEIIEKIFKGQEVVEIPGFMDLYNFSFSFKRELQAKLNRAQIVGGIFKLGFLSGMSGRAKMKPAQLELSMQDLYQRVVINNEVVYQKVQMPGVAAHSWLVIDVEPIGGSYLLSVVDSNVSMKVHQFEYKRGQKNLVYEIEDTDFSTRAVPYTERTSEISKLLKTRADFCAKSRPL